MNAIWSPEVEARFRSKLNKDSVNTHRSILVIAIPFFAAFAALDWVIQAPEMRLITFAIRAATVLVLLTFLSKKLVSSSIMPSLLLSAVALSLTGIALVSNDFESPYFFGLSMLIFLMPQLFPWSPLKIGMHSLGFSLFFVLCLLLKTHFHLNDALRAIEVCAYLFVSSLIAVWGGWISDRLRRESFKQFLEAEDSRKQIEQTVKVLQVELQQKSDDPVTLSKQLINRKSELQEEVWSEQEAKAQVEMALNTRDEFISIASHELKTPITVMKLQSWLLKKYLSQIDVGKSHPGILAFVERNDAQIKRLLRLVDDMLDLSRIRTGSLRLEPERVEFCALVKELVERYQPQFAAAGIPAKVVACEEVAGTWDRIRLEQVICNLFNNAIKYAPNAPLDIEVSQPSKNEIMLEIHDHGPGISKARQGKIFERFERAGADHSISGLGLGLYISRQIIISHGGDISIDNESPLGACFKVKLPTKIPVELNA